jgi:hypothetical protein
MYEPQTTETRDVLYVVEEPYGGPGVIALGVVMLFGAALGFLLGWFDQNGSGDGCFDSLSQKTPAGLT